MRFSVLLPTRNGAEFLGNCIRSILEQDYDDFELVISDNANTDSTADVIGVFLTDSRIKVVHQDSLIPVSDNWTAALHASAGEYVLMMGDDDYLLQGTLKRLDSVLKKHNEPDCILYNGYSYVSPKAISGNLGSFWSRDHFKFGADFGEETIIEPERRMDIVCDMFSFKTRIPLNMQTTLFSRRVIEQECGDVFQAPFPDHYLLNALLIAADKWVYLPEELVVIGVSPKSFGHFFYSQKASEGLAYLGIDTHFPGALPGSALLNGMGAWLHDLKLQYPDELKGTNMDWNGYVRRQVHTWILQRRYGGITTKELILRFKSLSGANWLRLLTTIFDSESWRRLILLFKSTKKSQAETLWQGLMPLPDVDNIREFAEWLDNKERNL